jgi:glutamate 5-kinase
LKNRNNILIFGYMRNFENAKRIVVKIGTNILMKDGGPPAQSVLRSSPAVRRATAKDESVRRAGVDTAYVIRIAWQITEILKTGRQVVIITSGAIGMGKGQLSGKQGIRTSDIKMRQACAAIGQPLLMAEYKRAFARYGVTVSQILLTAEVLNNRKTYLNLRNSIETLLNLGVVPILNENDSISTEEIGTAFGDNDKLSALVASKIDADLLIMLSDIDALYDKNPREYSNAQPIQTVFEITSDIIKAAGGKGSEYSTGGMKTKIEAAKITSNAGCRMVLANGKLRNVIGRIIAGEEIGTAFIPKRKLSNRARWILNSSPAGTIRIDEGAMRAVKNHKSLLPSGVTSVEGRFEPGDVVMLNDNAKAVTNLSSTQLKTLAGKHSSEIRKILGPKHRDVVAIPEDIVFIDS